MENIYSGEMPDSIDFRNLKPSRQEMEAKKWKLLEIFEDNIGRKSEGGKPKNIVLIGLPGAGKSSLINTFISSVSQQYDDYVTVGRFAESKPITVRINSIPAGEKYRKDCGDLCLPTFIDLAGMNDEDTELTEELLKIVLYGCLPKGQSLMEAKKYGCEYGIEELQNKYKDSDVSLKVDRIVFVASADETIPKHLMKCVVKAAMPTDGTGKRTIPIFGVLTKKDKKVEGDGKTQEIQHEFCGHLGLIGAAHRFAFLSSYCDDVDRLKERLHYSLPEIDVPALEFLTQICKTTFEVQENEETYAHTLTYQRAAVTTDPVRRQATQPKHQPRQLVNILSGSDILLMFLFLGFVLAVFASSMNPVVSDKEIMNACATHEHWETLDPQIRNPDLSKICAKKTEIVKPVSLSAVVFVWLTIVGIEYVFCFVDLTEIFVKVFVFILDEIDGDGLRLNTLA